MAARQLEQAFQVVGLELGEFARGEFESRVLGIERLRRLAEQPGDADVIDLGKSGEFIGRDPAVAGFDFADRGPMQAKHLGDMALGEAGKFARLF